MSSRSRFQRSQLSKVSKSKKKLDCFKPTDDAEMALKMENTADKIFKERENFSEYESRENSRKSLAWDSAFFTSPGVLEPEELSEILNICKAQNRVGMADIITSAYSKQELANSISELDTRRSLAWDSAFFTSSGVLDPEELSLINKGIDNSERNLHHRIDAKVRRSAESNSTITSDVFSLESLELDLFDDLKPPSFKSSKTYRLATTSSKLGRENGLQCTQSLKKLNTPARVRLAAQFGNSSSVSYPRPPKISGHTNSPLTAHKSASGSKRIKMESKPTITTSGHHYMNLLKNPCVGGDSTSVISKSTSFQKSPFPVSNSFADNFTRLRCSTLSDAPLKSPVKSLRKLDSAKAASRTPSPPRKNSRGKTIPVSSINKQFSGSLSKVKQRSYITPCREISFESNTTQILTENQNMGILNVSGEFQPSGLRKPSPTIGYFDEENFMSTPNEDIKFHSGMQTDSSKTKIINNLYNGEANRTVNPNSRNKLKSTLSENSNKKLDSKGTRILRPPGMRSPFPALFTENRGTPELTKSKNRITKQSSQGTEDVKRVYPETILLLEGDNENLCSLHNQVDGLCRNIEAICINQNSKTVES